jgi:hypothetical protein
MGCVQFEHQRVFGWGNLTLLECALRSFVAIGRSGTEIVSLDPGLKRKLTHGAGDDMTAGGR